MGEEEIKTEAKERKRGVFTQQTGLPSPSSYPCIRPPTGGDIDPRGAVNSSGMKSVGRECSQGPTPCSLLQALWICHNLGVAALLITSFSLSLSLSLSLTCSLYGPDTNTLILILPFSLFMQIWFGTHDGAFSDH